VHQFLAQAINEERTTSNVPERIQGCKDYFSLLYISQWVQVPIPMVGHLERFVCLIWASTNRHLLLLVEEQRDNLLHVCWNYFECANSAFGVLQFHLKSAIEAPSRQSWRNVLCDLF